MVPDADGSLSKTIQFGYYKDNALRESIYLKGLEAKKGKFRIESGSKVSMSWYNLGSDGDVLEGYLTLDSASKDTSWIEILEINHRFTKINGKFQIMMKVQSGNRWGPPGTRIFVTGEFNARK